MAAERGDRAEPRKVLKNAYVEYAKAGGFLARLLRPQARRGLIVNLSKGGLAFRTTQPIDARIRLDIRMIFPSDKVECSVKAEIRWVLPERRIGAENYSHIAGAKFVEYSPEAWATVQRIVRDI